MSSSEKELDRRGLEPHNGNVASYRQYCPVARASEILAERWSLLIVRNLMFGAGTFTGIARGVPHMSRSMLAKRLKELERAGVVHHSPKSTGQGSTYALTEAGADLAEVVDSLGRWAETWIDVLPEHSDPGFALWAWCQVQLDHDVLPRKRVVVRFEFPDQPKGNRRFWMLMEHGDAELCVKDPGGEPDLHVVADSVAFVDWHRGLRSWADVVRNEAVTVRGDQTLAREFPTWNTHTPVLA